MRHSPFDTSGRTVEDSTSALLSGLGAVLVVDHALRVECCDLVVRIAQHGFPLFGIDHLVRLYIPVPNTVLGALKGETKPLLALTKGFLDLGVAERLSGCEQPDRLDDAADREADVGRQRQLRIRVGRPTA